MRLCRRCGGSALVGTERYSGQAGSLTGSLTGSRSLRQEHQRSCRLRSFGQRSKTLALRMTGSAICETRRNEIELSILSFKENQRNHAKSETATLQSAH